MPNSTARRCSVLETPDINLFLPPKSFVAITFAWDMQVPSDSLWVTNVSPCRSMLTHYFQITFKLLLGPELPRGGPPICTVVTAKTGVKNFDRHFCCLTTLYWPIDHTKIYICKKALDHFTAISGYKNCPWLLDQCQKYPLTCWPLFDPGLSCDCTLTPMDSPVNLPNIFQIN